MKLRVPPAPLFLMFTKSVGANATPIAFAEVYLALQQKTVDGQENPLPTIMAKKFYEVQSHIMLTGHITESLLGQSSAATSGRKLNDAEKKIFSGGSDRGGRASASEPDPRLANRSWSEEFRKLGKTVDRRSIATAFRARRRCRCITTRMPGAGWSEGGVRRAAGARKLTSRRRSERPMPVALPACRLRLAASTVPSGP